MSAARVVDRDLAGDAAAYFRDLQGRICSAFESLEGNGTFTHRAWNRPEGHPALHS
jgi:coproporphyrinogen III oxidase